jgi:hypothetical protein
LSHTTTVCALPKSPPGTSAYHFSLWFHERPVGAVHLVVQSAGVAQVVAVAVPPPQRRGRRGAVDTLAALCKNNGKISKVGKREKKWRNTWIRELDRSAGAFISPLPLAAALPRAGWPAMQTAGQSGIIEFLAFRSLLFFSLSAAAAAARAREIREWLVLAFALVNSYRRHPSQFPSLTPS